MVMITVDHLQRDFRQQPKRCGQNDYDQDFNDITAAHRRPGDSRRVGRGPGF